MNAVRLAFVPFCAALCAALAAHVAIDVLGDYLLPHDTYDGIAHDSRALVVLGALGATLGALAALARATLRSARGSEHALCGALARLVPRSAAAFAAAVTVFTLAILAAMEGLDAALAGAPADDAADLFGGSLALGGGVALVCAAVSAALAWFAVRRLARLPGALARALASFVRPCRRFATPLVVARHGARVRARRLLARATRIAGRAPPASPRVRLVPTLSA